MANQFRSITPRGIHALLETLSGADPRIASFRLGDFAQSEMKVDDQYPAILYELIDSKILGPERGNEQRNEWSLRLYCFTMRRADSENVVDAMAETHNLLTDLVLRFKSEQAFKDWGIRFLPNANVRFDYVLIQDRDDLIGTSCEIVFTTALAGCPDDLLGYGTLPDVGLYYSASTITRPSSYLTCATLSGCSTWTTTIASIDTRLDALEAATGSTFDCAALLSCPDFLALSARTESNGVSILALSATTQTHTSEIALLLTLTGGTGTTTYVQDGVNTYTGGTASRPTVNLNDYIEIERMSATYTGFLSTITASNQGTGYAIEATSENGTGALIYSQNGMALQVTASDSGNTEDIAHFENSNAQGLHINNDGSLTWTSPTGAASTRTNLGINNTYVQPGTNITTGGTASAPTVNLVDSPSITNLIASGVVYGVTLSGGTIYSGGTNIQNLFAPIGSGGSGGVGTLEQVTASGNTANRSIYLQGNGSSFDLVRKVYFKDTDPTLSGSSDASVGIDYAIAGGPSLVLESPSSVFAVGGPSLVDVSSIPSVTDWFSVNDRQGVAGAIGFGFLSAATVDLRAFGYLRLGSNAKDGSGIQGSAFLVASGLTDTRLVSLPDKSGTIAFLDDLVAGTTTYVQPGSNITTGGTPSAPIVSVVSSPSFVNLTATTLQETTFVTPGGVYYRGPSGTLTANPDFTFDEDAVALQVLGTVSASTFFEGSLSLASKYAPISVVPTYVQPGTNTITGGTITRPTVNLVASPSVTNLTASGVVYCATVSADTHYQGSDLQASTRMVRLTGDVTSNSASYVDVTGLSFTVDANTSYFFEFTISYLSSGNTTGAGFSVTGPSSPVLCSGRMDGHQSAGNYPQFITGYDTGAAAGSVAIANAVYTAMIRGNFVNGANAGTLKARFLRGGTAGVNITVRAGSSGKITKTS
jgi:hypothetical protein